MSKKPLTADEIAQIEARRTVLAHGTLYDVLGVDPRCPLAEIENAYHDIARRWHPDRFFSRDTGPLALVIEENFVTATRAFRTLRDIGSRAAYDRELHLEGRFPPPELPRQQKAPPEARRETPFPAPPPVAPEPEAPKTHTISFKPRADTPAPPAPTPPPKPAAPLAVQKLKGMIAEQLTRAKGFYEAGKAEFDAGNFTKAEVSLHLAAQFDPKNPVYKALLEEARVKAAESRARTWVQQAEAAHKSMKTKEAISLYRKAVDCNPPEGTAYYSLATLLKSEGEDPREILALLRKAALKEPNNVGYRVALAEQYAALNLSTNALREVNAALKTEPNHDTAKALLKKIRAAM